MPAAKPKNLTIRSYSVGFGDCFLLTFAYAKEERHLLVDFGSMAFPDGTPKSRMTDIARDIADRCKDSILVIVATHRHQDHISGFSTRADGKGPGNIIAALKPKLVVQPWTENPKIPKNATAPMKGPGKQSRLRRAGLEAMHLVAGSALQALKKNGRSIRDKELRQQLAFIGEDNIANALAVKNLMTMARNIYVHAKASTAELEKWFPGVKFDVLGPPTIEQSAAIKQQRRKDPDEFWHLQARAMRIDDDVVAATSTALFPDFVEAKGSSLPVRSRWLAYRARKSQATDLLQIVRILDKAMNNTSLILLMTVGKKALLFPGDAQIENWRYALDDEKIVAKLKKVDIYKVGHHGSLNATPKSLWKLFDKRSKDPSAAGRLTSFMSTMAGEHGHEESNTEVPRRTLVSALKRESTLHNTQDLPVLRLFSDEVFPL